MPSQVCEAESIRAKQDQREVRLPHAQAVGTHLTSSPHTQIFYCKVQCEGDKWKKYKPIYTYVGYDQRDYTLVMDDFISRFSHPSLPLFSCAVMISYEEFTHTFVPVIVLLCSTMRISSAHYRIYKTFSSLCPFALFLCWDIILMFENCLKVCGKNLQVCGALLSRQAD